MVVIVVMTIVMIVVVVVIVAAGWPSDSSNNGSSSRNNNSSGIGSGSSGAEINSEALPEPFWSRLEPTWNLIGGLPEQIINALGSPTGDARTSLKCRAQSNAVALVLTAILKSNAS